MLAGDLCITIRFVLLAISFLQLDLIYPASDFWHIGAVQQLARLYALRFVLLLTLIFHYDMIYPTSNQLFAIRSDLSRQQIIIQRRNGANGTKSVHYDTICPTGNQLFALRSNLYRQRLLAPQRSAATGTSLCITIRFVLLLTTVFHYDMICPTSNQLFAIRFAIANCKFDHFLQLQI